MTQLRIADAAELLGVSDDTVRRMVESKRLAAHPDDSGRLVVAGAQVAALAQELARPAHRGLVTAVTKDKVMAQVELQCGPFRVVSLMSREAVDDLGLEVGSVAVASIKSTNVVIGVPQ